MAALLLYSLTIFKYHVSVIETSGMIDGEHLSRLHVIISEDWCQEAPGVGKEGASQRRVENDYERDRQQAATITNYHLALSAVLSQQPRISLLNYCAQHEARQVRLHFRHRSSMRNPAVSQHS